MSNFVSIKEPKPNGPDKHPMNWRRVGRWAFGGLLTVTVVGGYSAQHSLTAHSYCEEAPANAIDSPLALSYVAGDLHNDLYYGKYPHPDVDESALAEGLRAAGIDTSQPAIVCATRKDGALGWAEDGFDRLRHNYHVTVTQSPQS